MKRILATSLFIFYTSFNTGLILHLHYCGDAFGHLTLLVEPENCCGDDCSSCNNSSYELAIHDAYDNEEVLAAIEICIKDVGRNVSGFRLAMPEHMSQSITAVASGSLIHSDKVPIYLTNRVFQI